MQPARTVWALMFAAAFTAATAPARAKGPANQKYDIAAQPPPMALQLFSRISERQLTLAAEFWTPALWRLSHRTRICLAAGVCIGEY